MKRPQKNLANAVRAASKSIEDPKSPKNLHTPASDGGQPRSIPTVLERRYGCNIRKNLPASGRKLKGIVKTNFAS